MADKYNSFAELAENEEEDRDFRVRVRERRGTIVVIAPHGGGIEPGTSEIAESIAASNLSFCALEGLKLTGNGDLHITGTRFDEPRCTALVGSSPRAISVHGEDSERQVVFLGGRDTAMLERLRRSLTARDFIVETHDNPLLQGLDQANICNRTANRIGIQLELSRGLRLSFFQSLSGNGRRTKTERFYEFVAGVREAISGGTL